MQIVELESSRVRLRQWRQKDQPAFYALNSDPDVMEYFQATLSKEESDAMANSCSALIADRGWGFWAAELKATHEFMGFVGLHTPKASLPFTPCVEIGWRLRFRGCTHYAIVCIPYPRAHRSSLVYCCSERAFSRGNGAYRHEKHVAELPSSRCTRC